ncbi:hypothetical protein KP509_1Z032100 [Ceratopteris richardii]|nr:hypothetical protein KP509_1Z032100 [Ceratopteris richardii]
MEFSIGQISETLGFIRSQAGSSVHVKMDGISITYVCIYVDDLILTGGDEDKSKEMKTKLGKESKIPDLGELTYFLGIEVIRGKKWT